MITTKITGGSAIAAGLENKAAKGMSAIEQAVRRSALDLVAYIKSQKLSDQVLHVKTGTLRRSITAQFSSSGSKFTAKVGTNLVYARIHEYGFNGQVNVRAFQRMQTVAWGKLMKTPKKVNVRAHAMHMKMPERPFMRPSLEENRDKIITDIRRAITEALTAS